MKKKENNILNLVTDLSNIEKLYLYNFLLNIRQNDEIYRVNYKPKMLKSQEKNNKK